MPYFASPHTARMDPFLAALLAAAAQQQQQQQPRPQSPPSRQQESDSHTEAQAAPQQKPRAASSKRPQNRSLRAFSPNFDVYETSDAYYLEGELPGLSDKSAIDIEFADDRTMMVRGRVSRSATTAKAAEEQQPVQEKRRSLNPTVEDTDDEDDLGYSVVHHDTKSKPAEKTESQKEQEKKEERKIWLSERTFGAFQRSFSFPTPVDLDKTQATLEAGVLRIVVPKHVFHGARKIQVM